MRAHYQGPPGIAVLDAELPVERGDSVREALQARAVGVGAAAAVVGDLDEQDLH